MLKTKLLSVFVAFALMITVGGVYATWNYADGGVDDEDFTGFISITDDVTGSSKGAIVIDEATNFKILFDDSAEDRKTHTAVLSYSGNIVVKFSFAENTPADVVAAGIKLQLVVSNNASLVWHGTGENSSNSTPIFKVIETPIISGGSVRINDEDVPVPDVVPEDDGSYTWTLDTAFLSQLITLRAEDVVGDTIEEYRAIETLLSANKININFSEYVAPSATGDAE